MLGRLSWRIKMAATAAAVAAEEDTELRDLLVQTLENSGALNGIKAELRAAVFLALEEQEKVENKTPLVNESLKKFLTTKDGRLVASLVAEFLQFFNLDFTLAVFQPEASTFQGLEGRENLARDLGIIEAEGTVGGPLLLEVIRRCQQKEKGPATGEGALHLSDIHSPPPKSPEGKTSIHTPPSKIPRYKGQGKKKTSGQKSGDKKANSETSQSDTALSSSEPKSKSSLHSLTHETKIGSFLSTTALDVKDKAGLCPEDDDMEGDSFFDDPIPKPEKTYGWRSEPRKQAGSLTSISDAPPLRSGLTSLAGAPSLKEPESKKGSTVLKDLKLVSDKIGSLGLGTGEEDYVDDFNSATHRSEKSELSIGEEIEEDLSVGVDDINTSDKLDDLTQDFTVSQLSDIADYLEDVA
uniref:Centrosomal protein 43 n=1 Tax=Cavia porcellus TaxID=10141 RepID=A0A286Y1Y5_CAVPO|nr:FGFR1 oncogene partner isoform X2 [Cavia porcellus]